MKYFKNPIAAIFFFFTTGLFAQTKTDSINIIRTANNLSSGNFKDVLTSFFQIAYNDLSTDNKEFNFSSNLFAIKLKTDSSLNIDKNFIRQKFARNSNIEFSVKLDSNYAFNGVKAGYKYAIINKRDYAIAKSFNTAVLEKTQNYRGASRKIAQEISRRYPNAFDSTLSNSLIIEINDFFMMPAKKYGHLSDEAKELVRKFLYGDKLKIDNSWNARVDLNKIYENIKDDYSKKLLWTVSGNFSTYSDGFLFSNIDLFSEATAGIVPISEKTNIEFNVNTNYSFLDDTSKARRDMKRQIFTSEFGFNLVSRNKRDKPVLEFMAGGSFNYIPSGKYDNEDGTSFVFSGTLRVHITDNISIPLEIKYDPEQGNVFGFFNVKANFDWLNRVFSNLN